MKLKFYASSMLATFGVVITLPCVSARGPHGHVVEVSPDQGSSGHTAPAPLKVAQCDEQGEACTKNRDCCSKNCRKAMGKCGKSKEKRYKFVKTLQIIDVFDEGEPMCMSDDGKTLLVEGATASPRADVSSPSLHSYIFAKKSSPRGPFSNPRLSVFEKTDIFNPKWTNAMSGDGQVIALADYDHNVVRAYRLGSKGWYQFGQDVSTTQEGDYLGSSVGLSEDGNTLLVGADQSGSKSGKFGYVQRYEFEYADSGAKNKDKKWEWGEWKAEGDRITGDNENDELGRLPLEVSSEGNRIAVGGGTNGFASVHNWDSDTKTWSKVQRLSFNCEYEGWSSCTCDLTCIKKPGEDNDVYNDPAFGEEAIHMSSDGKFLAIGDSNYDPNRDETTGEDGEDYGAIYFYEYQDDDVGFVKSAETLVGENPNDYYGWMFAMSDDGETLAVGSYGGDWDEDSSPPKHVRILKKRVQDGKSVYKEIQKIPAFFWNAAFSKDGKQLALYGGDVDEVKYGVFLYELK